MRIKIKNTHQNPVSENRRRRPPPATLNISFGRRLRKLPLAMIASLFTRITSARGPRS